MECIIFRTENSLGGTNDFYAVPVPVDFGGHGHGNTTDLLFLEPVLKTASDMNSAFVSVGSSLFCVGGRGTDMFVPLYNICRLDNPWEADLRMLTPREDPNVVAMDGKLYIMGGKILEDSGVWGECFDPCSKESSPLPLPPPLPPSDQKLNWDSVPIVTAPLHLYKKIFVAPSYPPAPNVAFLYHVEDKVWEELHPKIDFSYVRVHGNAAVLRNSSLLCWIEGNTRRVQAYDLLRKQWFISPIEGLDKVGSDKVVPEIDAIFCSLFRLDDSHLCLLWEDNLSYHPHAACCLLHCTNVGVSISEDTWGESIFNAFVVSSRSYELEPGTSLIDGLYFCFGDHDDGRTEAINIAAPNQVPDQGSTGGSSSGGCGHDGRTYQGGYTYIERGHC